MCFVKKEKNKKHKLKLLDCNLREENSCVTENQAYVNIITHPLSHTSDCSVLHKTNVIKNLLLLETT